MKSKNVISILMLILFSLNCKSALFDEQPIEDQIDEAELIIKGVLLDKYSQEENIIRYFRDKDMKIVATIPRSIYTTFVFSIDEVYKGKFDQEHIEVKLLGGCNKDNKCVDYSINYDYKLNETGVLFLKKRSDNINYMVTQASNTAFSIDSENNIHRKSNNSLDYNKHTQIYPKSNGKLELHKKLNLDDLIFKINKRVNHNEK